MNIPKELYKRFNSHRLAQFFLYLLFTSDDDGNVKTTLRQMAEDNELSTKRVSKALEELETLGAAETKTKQRGNNGGSVISICKYEFYKKTLGAAETKTKQRGNNGTTTKKVAKKSTYDYSFVEPNLQKPFEEWLKYKQAKKQMYKRQCDVELCYKRLKEYSGNDATKAMQIVEQSMTNNWSGLFGLKTHDTTSTTLKSSEMNYKNDEEWG
ncbi:MAG: hypothetical protein HG422_08380 [Prevotella sp.]|nr:hypothetical protein [Prevotella sp.]